jgi:hypothetical protein
MGSFDDRSLSVFALALVALFGWRTITADRPAAIVPPPDARPAFTGLTLEARVHRIADAIAVAEGFYAPGRHNGRTLSYALNNPGLLKASPLAGAGTQAWQDTGLLVFPTMDLGWAALRYQVCTMLVGASRIYDVSDTLALVGRKYADGDGNWGANVAARLGHAPDVRLQELADDVAPSPLPATVRCRRIAADSEGGRHALAADALD